VRTPETFSLDAEHRAQLRSRTQPDPAYFLALVAFRFAGAAFFLATFLALVAFRFAGAAFFLATFLALVAFRFAGAAFFLATFLALVALSAITFRMGFVRLSILSAALELTIAEAASPNLRCAFDPAPAVAVSMLPIASPTNPAMRFSLLAIRQY
jgi:hypothetical protein